MTDQLRDRMSHNASTVELMLQSSLTFNSNGNLLSDDRTKPTFSRLVSINTTPFTRTQCVCSHHQTPDQYEEEYIRRLELDCYKDLKPLVISGTVFDATWAMVARLNHTAERVAKNDSSGCNHFPGRLVPLEHFDYTNKRMGCVMRNSYSEVKFAGITVSSVLLIMVFFMI